MPVAPPNVKSKGVRAFAQSCLSVGLGVLVANVVPLILRQLAQERIDLFKAAVRSSPLNVLAQAKHFRHGWCVPPCGEYERKGGLPACTFALLVRQHVEELLPPLRLWAHPFVFLSFGQYFFKGSHICFQDAQRLKSPALRGIIVRRPVD